MAVVTSQFETQFWLWYPCAAPPEKAVFDERMSSYVFGGATLIPKALYDSVWLASGGSVGTYRYQNALNTLQSVVVDVTTSPGTTVQFVNTPAARCIYYAADYVNPLVSSLFCPRSILD